MFVSVVIKTPTKYANNNNNVVVGDSVDTVLSSSNHKISFFYCFHHVPFHFRQTSNVQFWFYCLFSFSLSLSFSLSPILFLFLSSSSSFCSTVCGQTIQSKEEEKNSPNICGSTNGKENKKFKKKYIKFYIFFEFFDFFSNIFKNVKMMKSWSLKTEIVWQWTVVEGNLPVCTVYVLGSFVSLFFFLFLSLLSLFLFFHSSFQSIFLSC